MMENAPPKKNELRYYCTTVRYKTLNNALSYRRHTTRTQPLESLTTSFQDLTGIYHSRSRSTNVNVEAEARVLYFYKCKSEFPVERHDVCVCPWKDQRRQLEIWCRGKESPAQTQPHLFWALQQKQPGSLHSGVLLYRNASLESLRGSQVAVVRLHNLHKTRERQGSSQTIGSGCAAAVCCSLHSTQQPPPPSARLHASS